MPAARTASQLAYETDIGVVVVVTGRVVVVVGFWVVVGRAVVDVGFAVVVASEVELVAAAGAVKLLDDPSGFTVPPDFFSSAAHEPSIETAARAATAIRTFTMTTSGCKNGIPGAFATEVHFRPLIDRFPRFLNVGASGGSCRSRAVVFTAPRGRRIHYCFVIQFGLEVRRSRGQYPRR